LRRVVRYCDGWMPVAAAVRDPKKEIQNLHELAMQNGRDPKSFDVTMMLPRSDPKTLERHREAGVTRVVLALPIGGADAVLPRLDQLAKLIDA
jgi:alkanesulfonate monooxygenase SsuD/methylene tetrahydromethanopterin reductase-like flavin-dependent oxidoreductase (luciferase family)